jgi:hypothetical protein
VRVVVPGAEPNESLVSIIKPARKTERLEPGVRIEGYVAELVVGDALGGLAVAVLTTSRGDPR